MSQRLRQVELFDANDHSRLTCWLPVDPRLKAGVRITLKGIPKREWIVMRVFRTEIEETLINRRWQVGGLV